MNKRKVKKYKLGVKGIYWEQNVGVTFIKYPLLPIFSGSPNKYPFLLICIFYFSFIHSCIFYDINELLRIYEDDLKNEDNLKNENDIKRPKKRRRLKMIMNSMVKTTSTLKTTRKMETCNI